MTDPRQVSITASSTAGPLVAREVLRVRLKQLRVSSELSPATVAAHTGWSLSKLNRIENGEVTIEPLEVRALLLYYGLLDDDEVGALARLSQTSRSRQWYSNHKLAGNFRRFVGYESEAAVINLWHLLFVPGLLQTKEYAKAGTALSMRRSDSDRDVLSRVKLRMDRQAEFRERLGRPDPPRIVAVLDEAVLRRPFGGQDVLRRQLDHLLDLATDETAYTLGVMPLNSAHNTGIGGSFELLNMTLTSSSAVHPDVLFVEAAAGNDFLTTEEDQTLLFNSIMSDLLVYGRTGEDAVDMIRSIRDSLTAA